METKQLEQIEKWFVQLNQKIETGFEKIDVKIDKKFEEADLKSENRYKALLNVCNNLHQEAQHIKNQLIHLNEMTDKHEARITTMELAIRELERRIEHIS